MKLFLFGLVWFYGISTIVGYLMSNPLQFSKENSKVILVELTIRFESWLEESHDYKTSKYKDLRRELEKKGIVLSLKLWRLDMMEFGLVLWHSIICSRMRNNILITWADLKIYISLLDVDLIGCFNGVSYQWGDRCANKTVERKVPKWCTFSSDDPMEFNCSVEMRLA